MRELSEIARAVVAEPRSAVAPLALLSSAHKDAALHAMADALQEHTTSILAANDRDLLAAHEQGIGTSRSDRLRLDSSRVAAMAQGLRDVAALPDPVGEVIRRFSAPSGIDIEQVRVPFGLVLMIYESRPNVTVDAAALTLKTGNAVLLRGGSEALATNQELVAVMRAALTATDVPATAITLVTDLRRELVDELIRMRESIDLVIPRGGAGLIRRVVDHALVPVIETGVGNCHIFVDQQADYDMATNIVLNAKTQRPSVCNAAETLLWHARCEPDWIVAVSAALQACGVELRVCPITFSLLRGASGVNTEALALATEEDYETEFLDAILAIRCVPDLEGALAHIAQYGSKHSEAIVTSDVATAEVFLHSVDAAAVYHNASTRFTDGFEFGFGAEIGISTQKLHARGPMGLPELTTSQYRIRGTGQVRG